MRKEMKKERGKGSARTSAPGACGGGPEAEPSEAGHLAEGIVKETVNGGLGAPKRLRNK